MKVISRYFFQPALVADTGIVYEDINPSPEFTDLPNEILSHPLIRNVKGPKHRSVRISVSEGVKEN
jgi:hypothetical protein